MSDVTGKYNTYVGMRYVPLIMGDWDTTMNTEYDPLSVVTYQGNSYTSRTFVPKNIPITDTKYWALTGNYNTQIENYRGEVEAYARGMEGLSVETTLLLHQLKGKKICIIGASNEVDNAEWSPCWPQYLSQLLEGVASVTVNAVGGRRLTGDSGGARVFCNYIDSAADFDIYIIATSRNDYWNSVPLSNGNDAVGFDTVNAALFQMEKSITTAGAFDKMVYILGMFAGNMPLSVGYPDIKYPFPFYQQSIYSRCSKSGFRFIDAFNAAGTYSISGISGVTVDNTHFKPKYSEICAKKILAGLITGGTGAPHASMIYDWKNAMKFTNGSASFLRANIYPDYFIGGGEFTLGDAIPANTFIKIGTLDAPVGQLFQTFTGNTRFDVYPASGNGWATGVFTYVISSVFVNAELDVFVSMPVECEANKTYVLNFSGHYAPRYSRAYN